EERASQIRPFSRLLHCRPKSRSTLNGAESSSGRSSSMKIKTLPASTFEPERRFNGHPNKRDFNLCPSRPILPGTYIPWLDKSATASSSTDGNKAAVG